MKPIMRNRRLVAQATVEHAEGKGYHPKKLKQPKGTLSVYKRMHTDAGADLYVPINSKARAEFQALSETEKAAILLADAPIARKRAAESKREGTIKALPKGQREAQVFAHDGAPKDLSPLVGGLSTVGKASRKSFSAISRMKVPKKDKNVQALMKMYGITESDAKILIKELSK